MLLIIATIGAMLYTGGQALAGEGMAFNILGAFENTDVGTSLVYGGSTGLLAALVTVFKQKMPLRDTLMTMWIGARSM
ncbi:Na+/H+ antiporter NhaC family protein, partial [Guyparkeria sp. 1SP6A2]|nr:Na+/H+ antiporter NhaC family protein [Guyparkeria sp. 1SP6A2]